MTQHRECPDCGVRPGKVHSANCDVERCSHCGFQRISCGCDKKQQKNRLPWTGLWPGTAECEKYGLWCKMGPNGWQPCSKEYPDATHDLNTLYSNFTWDRNRATFVKG
jgi:hypothetical protein